MDQHTVPHHQSHELAGDLLHGADEIAEFIFGKRGGRRKVYYLAECARLPVFRLGTMLCARRSVLMGWIAGRKAACYRHMVRNRVPKSHRHSISYPAVSGNLVLLKSIKARKGRVHADAAFASVNTPQAVIGYRS